MFVCVRASACMKRVCVCANLRVRACSFVGVCGVCVSVCSSLVYCDGSDDFELATIPWHSMAR